MTMELHNSLMYIFADLHLELNMDTSWLKGWYLKQSQTWVPIIV